MRSTHTQSSEASGSDSKRVRPHPEPLVEQEPVHELQQSAGNQAMLQLLNSGFVQRKAKGAEAGAAESRSTPEAAAAPAKMLIVDDEAKEVAPGQMRKSDFLSQLRTAVCSTAEEALRDTVWSSMGCPYIDTWLDYYSKQPGSHVERALRKYAPETMGASTAQEYIPLAAQRVRQGIDEWHTTGEVKDLPQEFAESGLPAAPVSGSDEVSPGAADGSSNKGAMLFKHVEGGASPGDADPEAIRSQLGRGQALDGSVQRRMQSAFGQDFAGVRVHTDAKARELSEGLDARAFTIGNDIAFGGDEYKPGTPVGDALIAHELAHVVQQGAGHSSGPMNKAPGQSEQLEEDADLSAVGAVVATWTSAKGSLARISDQAIPRLRSGLLLQRCGKSDRQKEIERLGAIQYGHMEEKRKEKEDELKKEAKEEAEAKGLPPPVIEPEFKMEELVEEEQEKHAIPGDNPTKEWDEADQPYWRQFAKDTWDRVVASVKDTELEDIVDDTTFNFDPKTALEEGWYAWQKGNTLNVGMSWVRVADKDPKNAWENIAHEMGGHLKYEETYASEIMKAALSKLSAEERKKVKGDEQDFFETYEYPETEIYSSLWQRRYRVPLEGPEPESGGIHPDENIDKRLKTMKEVLHPEVALAVLKELKRRVDENDQILQRDKDWFVKKVDEIFNVKL